MDTDELSCYHFSSLRKSLPGYVLTFFIVFMCMEALCSVYRICLLFFLEQKLMWAVNNLESYEAWLWLEYFGHLPMELGRGFFPLPGGKDAEEEG